MSAPISVPSGKKSATRRLLESGVIFSAISFATGLINLAFQGLIGRQLIDDGEYSLANNTTSFINFLGLPLVIATTAVTHYIAHFHAQDDQAQLRGLLLGCRRVLLWFTVGGSVLAMVLIVPLSQFFNFPRYSLMLVALLCVLAGLWGSFATALCQGLSWFKRLAVIGLLSALLKCGFTWYVTRAHPVAEIAVGATVVALLANLVLLYWRKEIFQSGAAVSPWNREFVLYLLVGAACVGGNSLFLQGDPLVSQRYFSKIDQDFYSAARTLAAALPMTVGPLLVVLFTARSGERAGSAAKAQLRLLGLFAVGLVIGAAGLYVCRDLLVKLIKPTAFPHATAMIGPLAVTMVFGGLVQAMGMWSLASRWMGATLLYGGLGLAYWLALLTWGRTPEMLLKVMPIAAGLACVIMFAAWLAMMKRQESVEKSTQRLRV